MLKSHIKSLIPNQTVDPPPLVEINSKVEYEITKILDTKLDWRRHCKLLYLVCWTGYKGTNELAHAKELVSDFHKAYPVKPGPEPL